MTTLTAKTGGNWNATRAGTNNLSQGGTFNGWDTGTVGAGANGDLETISGADDADYGYVSQNTNFSDSSPATGAYDLENMPTDFATMNTLSVQLRYRWSAAPSSTTWPRLAARVVSSDGNTCLAGANSSGAFEDVATSITATTETNSSVTGFTYVDTTADKTAWDGAVLEILITRSRTKGGDSDQQRVTAGEITGDYDTASSTQNLTAGLFDDSTDTFPAPQVDMNVGPNTLFDDSTDTFPAATVASTYALTAGLFDDSSDTFPAATVTPGAVDISPDGVFDDSADTFPAPTVASVYALTVALFDDSSDTFPAAEVKIVQALTVGLFDDSSDSFPAATVTPGAADITPSLFDDSGDTFPAPTVSSIYALAVGLFDDSADTFQAPTVTATYDLTPSLFDDSTDTFPAVTLAATYNLSPGLLDDSSDTFPAATVSQAGGAQNLTVGLFDDSTDTFPAAVVTAGAVDISPDAAHANDNNFFAPTVTAAAAAPTVEALGGGGGPIIGPSRKKRRDYNREERERREEIFARVRRLFDERENPPEVRVQESISIVPAPIPDEIVDALDDAKRELAAFRREVAQTEFNRQIEAQLARYEATVAEAERLMDEDDALAVLMMMAA